MKSNSSKSYWIYGIHAVKAALDNPQRECHQLLATQETLPTFQANLKGKPSCHLHILSRQEISQKVGTETVHQGCAVKVSPLPDFFLEDIEDDVSSHHLIMVLDQVTDPHNVGAILRSCAAFGAKALILPDRHAPSEENGILAKTACGAMEHIPIITVPNLVRALESLKEREYWCIGLDEQGDKPLHKMNLAGKNVLIMGAEGEGLRRLTRETCDFLVKLPTSPAFPTLNVSNAAAVALYQFAIARNLA